MIKSKKQMFLVISVFTVLLMLTTITYAFFNYTRTGVANTIRVGRISFESKNEETITLNNLFPIDPENSDEINDNTKVGTYAIDIKGDTDYVDGIEYLVSVVDSNFGSLPISVDFTVTGLGTNNDNYFTARESKNANIYKILAGDTIVGDEMLLVGYIKPNATSGTAEGVDGNITIKVYLDENKILVSDTYDGTESDNMGTPNSMAEGKTVITTDEWNAFGTSGISFKIKVEANEGIWVVGSLEEIMKKNAVADNIQSTYVSSNSGIDFSMPSSDTNGKGVYTLSSTINDDNPIMYYRGAVEDNNVYFANHCWKAVRTTDEGGVKLIYNGTKKTVREYDNFDVLSDTDITYTNDTNYPFSYNATTKKWTSTNPHGTNSLAEFIFHVNDPGYYAIDLSISMDVSNNAAYIYKNNVSFDETDENVERVIDLGYLTSSDNIKLEYDETRRSVTGDTFIFDIIKYNGEFVEYETCNNSFSDALAHDNNGYVVQQFSGTDYESPAYVGYMRGDTYTQYYTKETSGAYFGNSITFNNGKYHLNSTKVGIDATHHYTCNSTSAEAECESVRYYFYYNDEYDSYVYLLLQNGETIEDALNNMFENKMDSNIKTFIDSWFTTNLSSYVNRLEDSIWCNDRSYADMGGWDPNGTDLIEQLYFGTYDRILNTYQVSITCPNKRDAFTVSNNNGNRKLTYPVGLLTGDEALLAGTGYDEEVELIDYYLNIGKLYWLLSPLRYYYDSSYGMILYYNGMHGFSYTDYTNGVRPSIVIKKGQLIVSGDGTGNNPYVIE